MSTSENTPAPVGKDQGGQNPQAPESLAVYRTRREGVKTDADRLLEEILGTCPCGTPLVSAWEQRIDTCTSCAADTVDWYAEVPS